MPPRISGTRNAIGATVAGAAQAVKDAVSGIGDTPTRPADANPAIPSSAPTDLPAAGAEALRRRRSSNNPIQDADALLK